MSGAKRAVLLIGFGGPEKPADVRPFLDNVLRGRPVPPERYEEVVRQYEAIGGASPYNRQVLELAGRLKERLAVDGAALPVYCGMRNWTPTLAETMARMAADGIEEAAGVVLASFRSEPSWDRYVSAVQTAAAPLGAKAPKISYAAPWNEDPLFIRAVSDRVVEALPPAGPRGLRWVFTAHSIPAALDRASGYADQVRRSAERVARALGQADWTLAFQSRSGRPEDPWLEPDVGDVVKSAAGGALVVPIGFLPDHVEVLFDLDVKARRAADEGGVAFHRARTVGVHPEFVRLLADRVRAALSLPAAARA